MKKLVGSFNLGFRPIRLYVDAQSQDGSVHFLTKDGGSSIITIGIDCQWGESLSVLLHELYEAVLIDLNTRYGPRPGFSEESSDFIFFATHNQLSEAHERVGYCLTEILPEFGRAYRKYSTYAQSGPK